MRRRPPLAGLLAVLAAATIACGSGGEGSREVVSAGSAEGEWTGQHLPGQPGADQPTLLAADGEQVVVVMVGEDGTMTGYASDDEGRFQGGEPLATGQRFLLFGGVARLGEEWFALGSGRLRHDELVFDVRAYRTADGRTWSSVDASGLAGPADVAGMVAVDGRLVAVGAQRTAEDPSHGGFQPVAWHSSDGASWTAVTLPTGNASGGAVQAVAVAGDELLAVGSVDSRGALWSSDDGGASWVLVEPDGLPATSSFTDVAVQDDVVVVSGVGTEGGSFEGEGSPVLLRSTDGGSRWQEATRPPPSGGRSSFAPPLSVGGGRFFAVTSTFVEAFAQPEVCYADIELCRQDAAVTVYVSADGDRWDRVDASGIGEGEAGEASEVDAVIATDEGRVVALQRVENGVGVWTWPADVALPTEEEPDEPTSDVDVLGPDEEPEVGRRYGLPLYIHCGMDWLYVGGEAWQRTDTGPDVETGAGDEIPADWPVAQQTIFGFATLVRPDLIEYSLADGEVIATYAPATEPPPGCE